MSIRRIVVMIILVSLVLTFFDIPLNDHFIFEKVTGEESGPGSVGRSAFIYMYSSIPDQEITPNLEGTKAGLDYSITVTNLDFEVTSYKISLNVDPTYSTWFTYPTTTSLIDYEDSTSFSVNVKVPNGYEPKTYQFSVTATAQSNASRYESTPLSLEILQAYGLTLTAKDNVDKKSLDDSDVKWIGNDRVVEFKLEVVNIGSGTDNYKVELIEDYYQSWTTISPGVILNLKEGLSQEVLVTVKIPKSTGISDIKLTIKATSRGDDTNYYTNDSSKSIELWITVTQIYNVYIPEPITQKDGKLGQLVQFKFDVKNRGNGDDEVVLKLDDQNGWPWTLSTTGFDLKPRGEYGDSKEVTLSVVVPTDAESRSEGYSVDLIVASDTPDGELVHISSGDLTFTIIVEQDHDIELRVVNNDMSCDSGDSAWYQVEITNLGNGPDTFDLRYTIWKTKKNTIPSLDVVLSQKVVSLPQFGYTYIWLNVTIPSYKETNDNLNIQAGDHKITVFAQSRGEEIEVDTQINLTINEKYEIELTALTAAPIDDPIDISADDPDGVSFQIKIKNIGTVLDKLELSALDNWPDGWIFQFFLHETVEVGMLTMEPGEHREIKVEVTFNGSTKEGIDFAGITALSIKNSEKYGIPTEDRVYINVSVPDLRITDIKFSDNPNIVDEITITVTVVNTGSGTAYDEVIKLMDGSKVLIEIPVGVLKAGDSTTTRFKFSATEGDHNYSLNLDRFNGTVDYHNEPFSPVNNPDDGASEKSGEYPFWILYVAVIFIMVVVWMAIFYANKGRGGSKGQKIQRRNQVKRRSATPDLSDDRVENREDLIDSPVMRYSRK